MAPILGLRTWHCYWHRRHGAGAGGGVHGRYSVRRAGGGQMFHGQDELLSSSGGGCWCSSCYCCFCCCRCRHCRSSMSRGLDGVGLEEARGHELIIRGHDVLSRRSVRHASWTGEHLGHVGVGLRPLCPEVVGARRRRQRVRMLQRLL